MLHICGIKYLSESCSKSRERRGRRRILHARVSDDVSQTELKRSRGLFRASSSKGSWDMAEKNERMLVWIGALETLPRRYEPCGIN